MKQTLKTDSDSNILFVTNRCNNRCLMCCQPPKDSCDTDYFFKKNIDLVASAPKDVKTVCITGGEPTLEADRLIELVDFVHRTLPDTQIHILSNGRNFANPDLARQLKLAAGDHVLVGVALHSDYCGDHDLIAGQKDAFNQTVTGLYNLADNDIATELRVVINKLNYTRLEHMSEFIFKNLYFVAWTAFMAMEYTGWAVKNRNMIWAEPVDYMPYLCRAVKNLSQNCMEVFIYNIPLCLIPDAMRHYAVRSISDWKVVYADTCLACSAKDLCCGLFGTSKRRFEGLKPINAVADSEFTSEKTPFFDPKNPLF
ncbi:MAG: His-Xaa-Ser system radical SAM maturase HxsC [Bacteroidales bacterium]|nr:His-Xaa-Ser system radical SAM maturase HxsC [Bacteroidales bacterium]MBP3254762.1 His-Xaa-Ser system radical SAM maturase HxsC [Bacteroidales bacterium]